MYRRHFGWIGVVIALALLSIPALVRSQDDSYSTDPWWQAHLARMKRIDALLADFNNAGSTTAAQETSEGVTIRFHREVSAYKEVISTWPDKPKAAVERLVEKYGTPQEFTDSQVLWFNNGPWKCTIVYRDEIPHDFPMAHTDYIEQVIDYRVLPGKFSALAAFDGSVIVDRTKGELAARCDSEEMNLLALNLANDIVTGRRTVRNARDFYARTAKDFQNGNKPGYTQSLQFTVVKGATMYRDRPWR